MDHDTLPLPYISFSQFARWMWDDLVLPPWQEEYIEVLSKAPPKPRGPASGIHNREPSDV